MKILYDIVEAAGFAYLERTVPVKLITGRTVQEMQQISNQEEYMKLVLKNIGKVQNATVEINGITVIAGENDTEKVRLEKRCFLCLTVFTIQTKKITAGERGKYI